MFFRSAVGALCAGLIASSAGAAERIEFMFPAPVQGKLSREMQKLVKEVAQLRQQLKTLTEVFKISTEDKTVKLETCSPSYRSILGN